MIKKLLKKAIIVMSVFSGTQLQAQTFDFDIDLQNWAVSWGGNSEVTYAGTEGVSGDGALKLERSGANSNFGIKNNVAGTVVTGIDATVKKFIRIRYKNETNGTQIRIGGTNGDDAAIKTNANGDINFSIGANSGEYVTSYIDMSSYTLWKGDLTNFYMMVRQNEPDTAGDAFYLDEIEFLTSMPAITYSEFIKNPSFDGPSGDTHLSGNKGYATRGITSTESHDGGQSLRFAFTSDAIDPFWTFSSYEKVYGTQYPANTDIQVKMWVKTNRATPISLSARVSLTDGSVDTATKPIATVTTTNTAMEWEEITFNLTCPDAFDGVKFWFALNYTDGDAANLLNGDIVYIDEMSATLTTPSLSTTTSKIEGASVKAENGSISVSGANLEAVYSVAGQQVGVKGLSSGIYIVKMSKGNKQDAVKVAL